uniref:Odorant Binding Protein 30 n=1 Tax=Dendrolimus punctatus TaxID=238572 RepID=A0A2K8GKN3_9NEOP|nr:Odorant Binding Protein 30 [Dendrolimus punctatus]
MGAFAAADKENKRLIEVPQDENFSRIVSKCTEEAGTTAESWTLIKEGKYSDTQPFKDFLYCISVKSNYFYSNGYPDIEKISPLYEESAMDSLRQCAKSTYSDKPTDVAFKIYMCFVDTRAKLLL